jgi:hypothetical protein
MQRSREEQLAREKALAALEAALKKRDAKLFKNQLKQVVEKGYYCEGCALAAVRLRGGFKAKVALEAMGMGGGKTKQKVGR